MGISTRPILSCRLKAATRLSRLSLTFFSKPEYVWMMYHCMPIDFWSPLDAKLLENVPHAHLHQLVHHGEKRPKERHRGDDHPGGGHHVFAAWPSDLLHFHADVMQKFTRAGYRAADFFADADRCSSDGVALRFFVSNRSVCFFLFFVVV